MFALAYTDSFTGANGLLLAVVSIAVGLAVWTLATLLLEGRLRGSALLGLLRRTRLTPPSQAQASSSRRIPRRLWVLLGLVILVAGCEASVTPFGPTSLHRFDLGDGTLETYQVEQPVLLGRFLAGAPAFVDTVQFAPDGRSVYVVSARGLCEALWSANATPNTAGDLVIDLRIGVRSCFPAAVAAIALYFAARIDLDAPVDPIHPPRVIDASSGESVPIETWQG